MRKPPDKHAEPDLSTFRGRFEFALAKRGVASYSELEEAVGTSFQNMRQWKGEPGSVIAIKLARALRVRVEWLILGEGDMDVPPRRSDQALEIAKWFDELDRRDRARAYLFAEFMFRKGRWPQLEDLQPDHEPMPSRPPDRGTPRA